MAPAPPFLPPSDEAPAAAAARARVDALLRELSVGAVPRLEIVLARAALAQSAPGASGATGVALLAAIAEAFPDSAAAAVAAARLELGRGDPARIAGRLAALTSSPGPRAWAVDGRWRCTGCGKTSPQFSWRCAGCRRWATQALETGAPEPLPPSPRERRGERRRSDGSAGGSERSDASLSGAAALPAPALDSGLSEIDLAEREHKRSLLGRAGGWLTGVWSGTRGP